MTVTSTNIATLVESFTSNSTSVVSRWLPYPAIRRNPSDARAPMYAAKREAADPKSAVGVGLGDGGSVVD
jgi:hypothetical protein